MFCWIGSQSQGGHKFGKIVRWLLFMLCPQAILAVAVWKNFAIICWRKTKRNQEAREKKIAITNRLASKYVAFTNEQTCKQTIQETICESISFSRSVMRLAVLSTSLEEFVSYFCERPTLKSNMTPLRGLNSLISTHYIKTYELLQCSKYHIQVWEFLELKTIHKTCFFQWVLILTWSFMVFMNIFELYI